MENQGTTLHELAELRQQLAAVQASEARSEQSAAEPALAERKQASSVGHHGGDHAELDLTTLLGLITQRAVDLIEAATSGVVYLWDEGAKVLIPQAWYGREWTRDVRLGLGEGIGGTVVQRRAAVAINDYRTSPYMNPFLHGAPWLQAVLPSPCCTGSGLWV